MSHIRPFSFKYHTKIAFCLLRLLWGRFLTDLISLQNKYFQTLGSSLSTTLRVVELFLVQIVGLWPCKLPYLGLWPQIQRYLVMVGFCVRQSKIHQILIRQSWRILWSSELQKMGIFWKLTKFWMKKSHFWPYFIHKNLINLCYKSVYSSRKHPV